MLTQRVCARHTVHRRSEAKVEIELVCGAEMEVGADAKTSGKDHGGEEGPRLWLLHA